MVLPNDVVVPPATEAELVELARNGDSAACEELAVRLRRPAYLTALQLLGNPEDALDVSQDSLIRFFTTLNRIQAGRPIKPWLLAIVRNRARDYLRRQKVRRAEPIEPGEDDYSPHLIDEGASPETTTRLRQLRRKLWQALGALPRAQREILVLRDYQDLSYAEIARVLRIPIGTVMSRLHRARQALRVLLEDDYGPGNEGAKGAQEP